MLSLIPRMSPWPLARPPVTNANSQYVWSQLTFRDGTPLEEVSETPLLIGAGSSIVGSKIVTTDATVAVLDKMAPPYIQANEDFSIEGWCNFSSISAYSGSILTLDMLGTGGDGNRSMMFAVLPTGEIYLVLTPTGYTAAYGVVSPAGTFPLNVDTHIAVTRVAGTLKLYLNGVVKYTGANSAFGFKSTEFLSIRRGALGSRWNIRMMRGKSAYTDNFTPPTSLPVIVNESYTSDVAADIVLQATMRRNSAVNEATGEAITLTGGASVAYGRLNTTAVNASRFSVPCKYFGAADYTIECKVRLPVNPATSNSSILGQYGNAFDSNCSWLLWMNDSRTVVFYWIEADSTVRNFTSSAPLPLNVDTHVVVEKVGSVTTMYFDGVVVASATSTKAMIDRAALRPVRSAWDEPSTANTLNITNIRIAKRAMYKGVFGVPSVTFPKFVNAISKLLTITGRRDSFINFNEFKSVNDNRVVLPNNPMIALDRALNQYSLAAISNTYPIPWVASTKLVSNSNPAGYYGMISMDGGLSNARVVGNGITANYGALLPFKDYVYEQQGPSSWKKHTNTYDLDGNITGPASSGVGDSGYWANNVNCVVGSTAVSAQGVNAYISWNFPTFIAYNLGLSTNSKWHYIGSNVFQVTGPNNSYSKLIHIGQSPGVVSFIANMDVTKASRIAHIGDYLFFIGTGGKLMVSPLASKYEDAFAGGAEASAYVTSMLEAIASPSATLVEDIGTWTYMSRWGDDRLVIAAGLANQAAGNTYIYGVSNKKPTVPFTIKAHQHPTSTSVLRSIGYIAPSVAGVSYGFAGNDPLATITQPAGETVLLCNDWYQKVGGNGYNGFGFGMNGATAAAILAKYRGVQVNGKVFLFSSALIPAGTAMSTGFRWTWGVQLADLVSDSTYVCELLPR